MSDLKLPGLSRQLFDTHTYIRQSIHLAETTKATFFPKKSAIFCLIELTLHWISFFKQWLCFSFFFSFSPFRGKTLCLSFSLGIGHRASDVILLWCIKWKTFLRLWNSLYNAKLWIKKVKEWGLMEAWLINVSVERLHRKCHWWPPFPVRHSYSFLSSRHCLYVRCEKTGRII